MKFKISLFLAILSCCNFAYNQLSVSEVTPEAAADIIAGEGVIIETVSFSGGTNQLGSFSGGSGIFGIESGVVIATGNVALAGTGNGGPAESQPANGSGYSTPLAAEHPTLSLYDAAQLTVTFYATSTNVQFDLVFASDEYLEYVGSSYNDVMGVYLDGDGFAPDYAGYENVSIIPGTSDFVSIQTVNNVTNNSWYINNPNGTVLDPSPYDITYDGFTKKMTIVVPGLTCGAFYRMNFSIADVADDNIDAALFIGANSIQSDFSVDELTLVSSSPFCEGDAFTASTTYDPSWLYEWSTGEVGIGLNSVTHTTVLGEDEISVTVTNDEGCSTVRTAPYDVHSTSNTPPGLLNTNFTYYTYANETICFNIYATDSPSEQATIEVTGIDGGFSLANFSPVAEPPEVYHEVLAFCWTPEELDYGVNTFTVKVQDNNKCNPLSQEFTFTIEVLCPLCPLCVNYEDRTPMDDPLPEYTHAAKCIEAGLTDPVETGDDYVEFKAGQYILLGDFFTEGPFFAEITGETCADECAACCEDFTGFRWDEPQIQFSPNGDGVNDIWSLNDAAHSYCAFNAKGYLLQVQNRWGRTIYTASNYYAYCCPFVGANAETGLDHTEIFWDGHDDDGDLVTDGVYYPKVTLFGCGVSVDFPVTVQVGGPDLYTTPNSDGGFQEESDIPDLAAEEISFFSCYPSPTADNLIVEFYEVPNGNTDIFVYDINSKLCLKQQAITTRTTLDVSQLPSGVYIITLTNGSKTEKQKFVKQ